MLTIEFFEIVLDQLFPSRKEQREEGIYTRSDGYRIINDQVRFQNNARIRLEIRRCRELAIRLKIPVAPD